MEFRAKAKLITCSLIDHIKEKKKEKSSESTPRFYIGTLLQGKNKIMLTEEYLKQPKKPVLIIQTLLEQSKPQNNERLKRRFTAQTKPKVAEENQAKNKPVLARGKPEPEEPPAFHLPPVKPSWRDQSPRDLIVLEEIVTEKGKQPPPPSHAHYHHLDKNFVRMLKEKQARAKVDAENAEIIASKLKSKKRDDLENMIIEKKMHLKCDEGRKWQEKVDLQKNLHTSSLATFWTNQKKLRNKINGHELNRQEEFSDEEVEEDSGTAQSFVYKQLADIKLKKAATRARLQEKQYNDAVTAQKNAEEAEQKKKELKRLAAAGEFQGYAQKVAEEKESRTNKGGEQEREEMRHKMKVFNETEDIQKGLLKDHCKGARRVQEGYAKAINEEFDYKQSKKRILCNAPVDKERGPEREVEWPYLTRQGNYMDTIKGAPLSQKRRQQSSNGLLSPQRLCLITECYTFRN